MTGANSAGFIARMGARRLSPGASRWAAEACRRSSSSGLQKAIQDFKLKAKTERAQPQNLELIERFKLPDIAHDPELYRLAGPWWNRRLQILWGCERTGDSSLPAAAAAAKLRADKSYNLRRLLTALLLLLLLLLSAWWLAAGWSWLMRRPRQQGQLEPERTNAARPSAPRSSRSEGMALPGAPSVLSNAPRAATSVPSPAAPKVTYKIVLRSPTTRGRWHHERRPGSPRLHRPPPPRPGRNLVL